MAVTVAFINEDGGAGKTTYPASLSTILSKDHTVEGNTLWEGKRILLVDLTPKCSLTRLFMKDRGFGRDNTLYSILEHNDVFEYGRNIFETDFENIKIAVGCAELENLSGFQYEMFLKQKLEAIKADFDWIFIDTANNGVLVNTAICASDYVYVICKTSRDSFNGVIKAIESIDRLKEKHGLDVQILEIGLNRWQDNIVTAKTVGELQNNPRTSEFYNEAHNVPESATVNRLQYDHQNIGLQWHWLRVSKVFYQIAQDLFA